MQQQPGRVMVFSSKFGADPFTGPWMDVSDAANVEIGINGAGAYNGTVLIETQAGETPNYPIITVGTLTSPDQTTPPWTGPGGGRVRVVSSGGSAGEWSAYIKAWRRGDGGRIF